MAAGTVVAARAGLRPANRLQSTLDALRGLCSQHESVDALLEDATRIVPEVLRADYCGVVWLDEGKPTLRVRARRRSDGSLECSVQDAQATAFVARTHGLATDDGAAAGAECECAGALRIGGRTVGYLYARIEAKRRGAAAGLDRALFDALAEQLAFAIEAQTLRQLLASRYATIALSRNDEGDGTEPSALDANFLSAVTQPEKVARIIARSFYKDLRKAGFETRQILVVATELIDSLNAALRRTKAKTTQVPAGEASAREH